jgi:hypothetical protein
MRRLVIAALVAALSRPAPAQEVLLPSTAWGFAPVVSAWHFTSALVQSTGLVKDVGEVAVPFQLRTSVFGGSWNVDLTGAYAFGAIHVVSPDSGNQQGGGNGNLYYVTGPTDVKLRATGPLLGDGLLLSLGVNLPTGTTKLNANQTAVLQIIAAPALHLPVGAFGTGAGGTLGLVKAIEAGDWALALGGSVEQRTEYTPIALVLASGQSNTQITPGTAAHVTLGADRVVGDDRLSFLVVGDGFAKDKVLIGNDSGSTRFDYQLGPQITGFTRLDMSGPTWREAAANVAVRYRTQFSDATGAKVVGSNGTYVEGSLDGVLGGAEGAGLVLGIDGRWHSGLSFTDALVGAAATVGGATLGVELPMGGALFHFAVHGQYGTFDTGVTKTTGFGGALIVSFARRRGGD